MANAKSTKRKMLRYTLQTVIDVDPKFPEEMSGVSEIIDYNQGSGTCEIVNVEVIEEK